MAVQNSYHSYDWKPCVLVPVIASFDTEGHVRPLYLRLEGRSFKVESYWEKRCFSNVSEFMCHITVNSCLRIVALTYYHDTQTWTVPK